MIISGVCLKIPFNPKVFLGERHILSCRSAGQDEVSKTYSFPKSYVSYRKPRSVNKEQRERARQMMIEQNRAKKD